MKIDETYYRMAVLTLTAVDNRLTVNDKVHDFPPHFQDLFLPYPRSFLTCTHCFCVVEIWEGHPIFGR